ncbi:MAG TPA: hypothetical protein VIL85_09580 [Thermomicrobiales bacterium]|jgi:hypothetical protein
MFGIKAGIPPGNRLVQFMILGVTLLPMVAMFVVYVLAFRSWGTGLSIFGDIDPVDNPSSVLRLIPILLVTGVMYTLIAYYTWLVIHNAKLSTTEKTIWAIAILQASIVAMPIYWYLHFWRASKQGRQTNSTGSGVRDISV